MVCGLSSRGGRVAVWASLLALGAGLIGCKSGGSKYNLALEENQELRQRVVALQSAKEASDERAEAAEREAEELAQALREAQGELDSAPAGGSDPTVAGGSPFSPGELPQGVTVSSRGSDIVVTVAGDVLFDSGKATLKTSAQRDLQRLARTINQRYPSNVIRVEGYTDNDPIKKSGWKSNEHLSAERALAVEMELVANGIGNERIYSAAFGPARQKNSKQDSRRVEIIVLGPEG